MAFDTGFGPPSAGDFPVDLTSREVEPSLGGMTVAGD